MNNDENAYFTFKGYQLNNDSNLTSSMEDYLEMIIRLKEKQPFVRINELANNLNVRPSSASKMVTKLSQEGFLEYQKYGIITLTELGKQWGEYFIYRHQVLNNFLCLLNNSHNELEQVEKIEHFLNKNNNMGTNPLPYCRLTFYRIKLVNLCSSFSGNPNSFLPN